MASQTTIDSVKLHLADEATSLGITNDVISNWLDSGLSTTKTILAGWRAIAAKTVGVEDVSESGSSRTIRLHERAIELVRDWQARSDAEDQQSGALPAKQNAKQYVITRV